MQERLITVSLEATGPSAFSSFVKTSEGHMQPPRVIQREQELKVTPPSTWSLMPAENFLQPNVQAPCAAVICAAFSIFETQASYCWHTQQLAKCHPMIQHIKKKDRIMNHCAKRLCNRDWNRPYKSTVALEWEWLFHGRYPSAKKHV